MGPLLSQTRKEVQIREVEIHLKTAEMILNQTEAERALNQTELVWITERNLEENLNQDKVETRKHQEVLMPCSITKNKWIN